MMGAMMLRRTQIQHRSTWDEYERLRQLVPPRPDWHLANWGDWCRTYRPIKGSGGSSVISCGRVSATFDDLCEVADRHAARVSDSIVSGLVQEHRLVLSHVYEASVFRVRRDVGELLTRAALDFWREATRRGLS